MLHDNSGPVFIVPRMIIHHDQELLGGPVHHGLQRSLVDWLERRRAGGGTRPRARCDQESNTDQQARGGAYGKFKRHFPNDHCCQKPENIKDTFIRPNETKISDPARGTRELQPERDGRVRSIAWLSVAAEPVRETRRTKSRRDRRALGFGRSLLCRNRAPWDR